MRVSSFQAPSLPEALLVVFPTKLDDSIKALVWVSMALADPYLKSNRVNLDRQGNQPVSQLVFAAHLVTIHTPSSHKPIRIGEEQLKLLRDGNIEYLGT